MQSKEKSMAQKKIDREFCLTDESVNVYGYRLITSGLQLERFKPAIGFLMHDREKGVAVKWEDFRIDGDKLYAKPVVNESRFPNLSEEIEAGFYSGVSVGKIIALELSVDENLMLDGQTGPTVTKWFPREASIVDIPGNYSALAQLYDEGDNVLQDLSDTTKKTKKMETIQLTVEQLNLLDLKEDSTGAQVTAKLKDLADKANRTEKAEKELEDLKATTLTNEVKGILKDGMDSHKLTKELSDKLERDYVGKPAELKALVDAMPAQRRVTGGDNSITGVPEKYAGKSFNDLYLSGDLADVKKNYPDLYNQLKENKED
jgi:hypothetical protein